MPPFMRPAPRSPLAAIAVLAAMVGPLTVAVPAGAQEAPRPLTAGDPLPAFAFEGIEGRSGHTDRLRQGIVVVTAADRHSSDRLMAWQRQAGVELAKAHPGLAVTFLNVADVSAVPGLFTGIVEPILRRINANSQADMAEMYAAAGVTGAAAADRFYLVPDWDGAMMGKLGIADAERYRVWIVADGVVVAALPEGTPAIRERYVELVGRIHRQEQRPDPRGGGGAAPSATPTTAP